MRILVVDDEEAMRSVLSSALTTMGHEVESAVDGHHALMWLEGSKFDVILTDLQMPGIDGVELIQAAGDACQRARWIVITADPASARLAGLCVPILAKPFRLPQLAALLEQVQLS